MAKNYYIALLTIGFLLPAHLSTAEQIGQENLQSIVEQIVPEILDETHVESSLSIEINEVTSNPVVSLGEENTSSPISLELLGRGQIETLQSGLTVAQNPNGENGQLIQPLADGFRVINVTTDRNGPAEFKYQVHLPTGASLVEVFDSIQLRDINDDIIGSFKTPWARDAAGASIETWYEVHGDLITQKLKFTEKTHFPVVSDPYWGYLYHYGLGVWPATAWDKLHNCFNCYFPVVGAPSAFPKYGQLLPLRIPIPIFPMNMECKMGSVSTNPKTNFYAWQFNATKNHVDGLGSNIIFQLRINSLGYKELVVDAYIVKDFWLGNLEYANMAKSNWQTFAENLSSRP
jgi:hypothetical protein